MAFDYPSSPSIGQVANGYVWDGEKWVSAGSVPGPAVARVDALGWSGMQINGSMEVSQEYGTTVVSSISGKYLLDGWRAYTVGVQGMIGVQQSASLPSGFINALQMNVNATPNTSPAAGDMCFIVQAIEGYRTVRLAWGTASARPITIGFWINSLVTAGTYSAAIRNFDNNRSYVFTFNIATPNVWQWVTATVPGDTAGTWAKNNTPGMYFSIAMMAGSSLQTAPGAWINGNFIGATGAVNGVSTTNIMQITGVVILPGTEAPTAAQSPLIMRPYGEELLTCKRYFEQIKAYSVAYGVGGSGSVGLTFPYSVEKRATPTAAAVAAGQVFTNCTVNSYDLSAKAFGLILNVTGSGTYVANSLFNMDARL